MNSGVYKIRNIINNKVYVGSTTCFKYRWSKHQRTLLLCSHHSIKLQRAWDKYGPENFVYEIIEYCEKVKVTLLAREQYWIDTLDSYNNGYNINPVAGSRLGVLHTPEAIIKIKEARAKQTITDDTKEKIRLSKTGKKQTKEHAENAAKARIGKPHVSEEGRQKISIANSGENNGMYGKKGAFTGHIHSDEAKQKNREAHLGKSHTDKYKQEMSDKMKGIPKSEEHKQHLKEAWIERRTKERKEVTDEARYNMSEAQKSRWAKIKGK